MVLYTVVALALAGLALGILRHLTHGRKNSAITPAMLIPKSAEAPYIKCGPPSIEAPAGVCPDCGGVTEIYPSIGNTLGSALNYVEVCRGCGAFIGTFPDLAAAQWERLGNGLWKRKEK